MTETAAEIIADGQEVESEEEEEQQSVDEEFRDLQKHTEDLALRLNKVATTLEAQGTKPATKKDIAQLYRFMSGDVVNCIRDLVAASGAAFIDVFDIIDSGDGDEDGEGSDEEDNTPSDTDIQVYTTLLANIEAFTNLSKTAGLPETQKNAFEQMIQLNRGNLEHFHEGFGEEVMKEAAAKQVSEAQGGSAATE
jgi:hypothetical protein